MLKKISIIMWILILFGMSYCSQQKNSPKVSSATLISPKLIRALEHDPHAFTQGFAFYKGILYESTGLEGQSSLRAINPLDGSIIKKIMIPDVFAEGLTIAHNRFVVLTWKNQKALLYLMPSMTEAGYWNYNGEGWGIAWADTAFVMSNGSDTLYLRNATDFRVISTIAVKLNGKPLRRLNELEYVSSNIYANVWYCDSIFEISMADGNVRRVIDCSLLVKKVSPTSRHDVLNGIAYNPGTKTFYITGKNWHNIFEIKIE